MTYIKDLGSASILEAKGSNNTKNKHQIIHNSFYTLLGQILFRMDKEGNSPRKGRIYAITIPEDWVDAYREKIKQMPYGWNLLKLRVFVVSDLDVKEYTHKQFIK